MNIDHLATHAFFRVTKKYWFTRHLAIFASSYAIWLMLGILLGVISWNVQRPDFFPDARLLLLLPILLPAWMVTMVISLLVRRVRPYLETKETPLMDPFVHTASFPSAHATMAFSLAALAMVVPSLLPFMLILAIVVGLGRVASGVHFFSDVFIGSVIGFCVTLWVIHLFPFLLKAYV